MRRKAVNGTVRIVLDMRDARRDRLMDREIAESLHRAGKLVRGTIYNSEVCYVPRRRFMDDVARHYLPRDTTFNPGDAGKFHWFPNLTKS